MPFIHKRQIIKLLHRFFRVHNRHTPEAALPTEDKSEWSKRDTLIGVLRNTAQLDTVLEHKFYHIPAKYISEYDLPIKYIAIYQSKSLFGNKAGVYYYGEVVSYTCVKRKQIKEIPKNSGEYYYRFNIKQWHTLKNPIEAKEIGFVRIYTNFEMMQNSTEIPQLLLKNKEIHNLYTSIKNAIAAVQANPQYEYPIIRHGIYNIAVELDDIIIFKNATPINCFSVYDFMDIPNTIMTQIYKYIKK